MTRALFDTAWQFRDHPAIVDSSGSYSYRQLLHAALSVRRCLLGERDTLGEARIAFLIEPGFRYVAVQWGIWISGGVAVPLCQKHPAPELAYVLSDCSPASIIVDSVHRAKLPSSDPSHSASIVDVETLLTSILACGEEALEKAGSGDEVDSRIEAELRTILPAIASSRRAMILYTSGSTGRPKGVVSTHANIVAQVESLVAAWEWRSTDRILDVLPMHHIHGIINVLCCAMRVGAVCEFQPSFEANAVWESLSSGHHTLFMAVPTIYAKLIAHFDQVPATTQRRWADGVRGTRLNVSGSAALPVSVLERWENMTGQRLLERYGMTEIGMALSNPLHGERRAGHVGSPLPGVEVRRTDETGQAVSDDAPGEILVRGPNVFLEYWNRPETTAESFRDGWFRTGDIAVVDANSFRIMGRSSVDIIKTGGYKVSALEVEDELRTHAQIRDCAVVGLQDEMWGERVAACVVLEESGSLDLVSLRQWGKERLASYKVPTVLKIQSELPRNAMGKVQKLLVRQLFSASDEFSQS